MKRCLALWLVVLVGAAWAQNLPAPKNLKVTVPAGSDATSRLELRWDPVPGAQGYEVLQWRSGEWWLNEEDPNRTPLTSSTTITGLSADTPYEFCVRAVGDKGLLSPNSETVGGRTLARPAPNTPRVTSTPSKPPVDPKAPAPDPPTGVIGVFPEQDRVQLSWRKVPGAARYYIEEEIEGQWVPAKDIVGEPEASRVIVLYHSRPGPYRFRIFSIGSNGKRSDPSWPVTVERQ